MTSVVCYKCLKIGGTIAKFICYEILEDLVVYNSRILKVRERGLAYIIL